MITCEMRLVSPGGPLTPDLPEGPGGPCEPEEPCVPLSPVRSEVEGESDSVTACEIEENVRVIGQSLIRFNGCVVTCCSTVDFDWLLVQPPTY